MNNAMNNQERASAVARETQAPAELRLYERIAAASSRMLHSARMGDWDTVIEQERECRALVDVMRSGAAGVVLDADGRRRKRDLLMQVLEHDARIRELAEPWLAKLGSMLGSAANSRRLGQAYGAGLPAR